MNNDEEIDDLDRPIDELGPPTIEQLGQESTLQMYRRISQKMGIPMLGGDDREAILLRMIEKLWDMATRPGPNATTRIP